MRLSHRMPMIAVLLSLLVLVSACAQGKSAQSGTGKSALETTEIKVATGIDISNTPWMAIAKEKGYFAEEGLTKVDWSMFGSGAEASQAVGSGSYPLGFMADSPALALRAAGVPVVVLAGVSDIAPSMGLWVAKDLNITKPSQLQGLKIAYASGSAGDAMLTQIAEAYKLDRSKIVGINLSPADAVAAFGEKQIDGAVYWEPWIDAASQKRPTSLLHTGKESFFAENQGAKVTVGPVDGVLIGREDFVRKNPNTLSAFLRAIVKAQDYIAKEANRDSVIDISAKAMDQQRQMVKATADRVSLRIAVDVNLENDIKTNGEFMKKAGRIKETPLLRTWLYSKPLKEIRPEWVNLEGEWKP